MFFFLQNIPTLGTVAITMALHNCDEVAVAGFGYNMSTPHAPLHYYEKIRMVAIKEVIGGVSVKGPCVTFLEINSNCLILSTSVSLLFLLKCTFFR